MGVEVTLCLFNTAIYERSVLPAYRAFKNNSDTGPLLALLQEAFPDGRPTSDRNFSLVSPAAKQYYIEKLTSGSVSHSHSPSEELCTLVDNEIAPSIADALCVPHENGKRAEQNMSEPPLMSYLYSQSEWIERYFTFAKEPSGAMPEIRMGEWSRFFSIDETRTFEDELLKIRRPIENGSLKGELDELRKLVHMAVLHPTLAILVSIQ